MNAREEYERKGLKKGEGKTRTRGSGGRVTIQNLPNQLARHCCAW